MQFSVVWRSVLSIPSEDFMNQPQKTLILFQRECGVEASMGRRIEGSREDPRSIGLVAFIRTPCPRRSKLTLLWHWMICAYLSVSLHAAIRTSFLVFYSERTKAMLPPMVHANSVILEGGRNYNRRLSSPKISRHILQIMRNLFRRAEGWLVSRINNRLTGYSICQ